jgi:ATP-dependent protease ClpP protease subunit
MHIFIDFDIINQENKIEDLINRIEDYVEPVTLVLSSNGGDPFTATILLNYLNGRADKVTLIASDFVASAAFRLFQGFKGKRQIVDGTCGAVHERTINNLSIKGKLNNPSNKDVKFDIDRSEYFSDRAQVLYGSFLTKKEMSAFKKGEDVELSFKRMMEIFPEAKIIE